MPSNSALSYTINSCHMWLVLCDPLCRGRIWAFATEKETYVGFKSTVQITKTDWSQFFVGWFLNLFISYDEGLRNLYKRYLYHIGNSCPFYPMKFSRELVSYLWRTTEVFHHKPLEGKDKESTEFLGRFFNPPSPLYSLFSLMPTV